MNLNKVLKIEIKFSRLVVVTIFWVMLLISLLLSGLLIQYCSNIHQRDDMLFIKYNFVPLARAAKNAPEEWKPFIDFNLSCMVMHVKEGIMNMELFILAVLFFNINTFVMLFVVYRRKKRFLYMMCIIMVMYTYSTFTYCRRAADFLPQQVVGDLMLDWRPPDAPMQ